MPDYMDDIGTLPTSPESPSPDNAETSANSYDTQSGYSNAQNSGYNSQSGYNSAQNSGYNSQSGYGSAQNSGYNSQLGYGNSENSYAGSVYDQNYGDPYANSSNNILRASHGMDAGDIAKCVLAAVAGSIPGFLLWIILGKAALTSMTAGIMLGLISSIFPVLLSIGTFIGYYYVTKDRLVSTKQSLIICISVIAVMILLANRIVFAMQLSEICNNMKELLSTFSGFMGVSSSELDGLLENIDTKEITKEITGYEKVNFGTCFVHLGSILDKLEMKGDYLFNQLKCFMFAFIGSAILIKHAQKRNII